MATSSHWGAIFPLQGGGRERAQASPGKKISISRAADSGPSEPWMRFSVSSTARSPRIVPGGASAGLVGPMSVRTTFQVPSGPATTMTMAGLRQMNLDKVAVKRLADVLRIMAAHGRGVDRP